MGRKFKIIGTALFLIFLSINFQYINHEGSANTASLPSTVKIGFLYPATGGLGAIGDGLMAGAIAAAYRANKTFGQLFNVTIVASDTATDPTTAKSSAQTLISDGVQVIVGAAASGATLAASEVTIPNNVPLISYASTSPSITDLADNDFVLRVVASDAYQGIALANLSYNSGATSVYILNLDNAYGNSVAAKFATAYTALGGTIVGQTAYDPAATSFATEISSIKSNSAQGVILIAYPNDANKIFAEAQTQGISLPWFGTDGIASSSVTNNVAIRDYLNGTLFGTTPSTGADAINTIYSQFISDLASTSGSYGVYGDYVYDAVLLAAAAVNKTLYYNGPSIRNALYSVANGFKGATSPDKSFNCDGEPVSQTYDYWNATNYAVTTQVSAAASFTNLGSPQTFPCGLHPYLPPTTGTGTSPTTGLGTSTTTTTSIPIISSSTSSQSSSQVASSSTTQQPPVSSSSSLNTIPASSPGFELLPLSIMFFVTVIVFRKRNT